MHVVEDPFVSGAWPSEMLALNIPELLNELTTNARQRLEELKTGAAKEGIDVGTTVVVGRPASTIVEHAERDTDSISS